MSRKKEDAGNDEKAIIDRVKTGIDQEIERLKQLKKDKKNLLAKLRIVFRSCLLLAIKDGEVSRDELLKMNYDIFRKYGIVDEEVRKYLLLMKDISLSSIEEDLKNYKIDKEFLKGVYNELYSLACVDGKFKTSEQEIISKIHKVFEL
jgi:tellurite resistance protein